MCSGIGEGKWASLGDSDVETRSESPAGPGSGLGGRWCDNEDQGDCGRGHLEMANPRQVSFGKQEDEKGVRWREKRNVCK